MAASSAQLDNLSNWQWMPSVALNDLPRALAEIETLSLSPRRDEIRTMSIAPVFLTSLIVRRHRLAPPSRPLAPAKILTTDVV